MDRIRVIMESLAAAFLHGDPLPVVFAACHTTRSATVPSPVLGLAYQAEGVYDWWEQGTRRFQADEGCLFPVFAQHGSRSSEPRGRVRLWVVTFDVSAVPGLQIAPGTPPVPPLPVRSRRMVHGAFECVSLRFRERRGGAGRQLRLRSAVADFLATLLAECTGEHPGGDSQVPAVRRAVRFMHSRLRSPDLDLGAVAAAAGLSPHHFGRVFQRELGLSPMRYLRDLRLDAAGDLLRTTSLRVCEVAEEVGFRDPLHFSRVWHRCCGLSPTAYRDSRRAMAPAP